MDYARFCQMLLNGGIYNDNRILSRKTIELMNSNQLDKMNITPRSLLGKNGNSFGLGFALITDKSTSHAHGSSGTFYWGGIFNTRYWIDPREELLVVIMAQILPFPGNDIWNKLSTIIYSSIDD
jgi:CubicO group peptidase (beta-lactamase class C family)